VLGLPPTLKYAEQPSDGYPSLAKIAGVLLSRAGDPATELRRFLQQLTLNIALGNLDAHAKNYSVQHRDGVVTLSPLYDVVPTRPFIPTDRRAAMFVGGKIVFDDITRGHLLAEARSWGIPERIARETIADTLDRLDQGIARADQSFPALADEVRTAIRRQYDVLCSSPW
jgi:serine/threonine-protein kinase HipA